MANMFPFTRADIPSLPTREALLVIDAQNDFLSPDGPLSVAENTPDLARRIADLATRFRDSGKGDVLWIRSQWEAPRALRADGDQILATDSGLLPTRPSSRARQASASAAAAAALAMQADPEAFLSQPAPGSGSGSGSARSDKPKCVRADTAGVAFPPEIVAAIDARRDRQLTKTHYSAFPPDDSGLLQLLRLRFVTKLYLCGALTNISLYATAICAASHGYDTSIVEDCCGYRSEMRHGGALRKLAELTGCEAISAADVFAGLELPVSPRRSSLRELQRQQQSESSTTQQQQAAHTDTTEERESPRRSSAQAVVSKAAPEAAKQDLEAEDLESEVAKLRLRSPTAEPPSSSVTQDAPNNGRSHSAATQGSPVDDSTGQPALNKEPSGPPAPARRAAARAAASPQSDEPERASPIPASRSLSIDSVASAPIAVDPSYQASASDSHKGAEDALGSSWNFVQNAKAEIERLKSQSRSSSPLSSSSAKLSIVKVRKRKTSKPVSGSDKSGSGDKEAGRRSPGSSSSGAGGAVNQSLGAVGSPVLSHIDSPPTTHRHLHIVSEDDVSHEQTAAGRGELELPPVAAMADTSSNSTELIASEQLCAGDTTIFQNVLPPELAGMAFETLQSEVAWARMSHQGGEVPRLVAVQGAVEPDGSMPVYRHPSDESPPLLPFTPTVNAIKQRAEKLLGHELNHVLIQFYRDGNDYISEHSDKTLDIVRDSFIANVSLGAERTMVFRTKRVDKDPSRRKDTVASTVVASTEDAPADAVTSGQDAGISAKKEAEADAEAETAKRQVQRAALPHNSMCRMGLQTNMRWLHAIRQDKRRPQEKTPAELAFAGGRISLTFRRIGTFLSADQTRIWGQGATSRTKQGAKQVVNGQTPEAIEMLRGFGTENHTSEFDWDKWYGRGFDVLHMSAAPRWFSGPDAVVNMRVALLLAEYGIACAKGSVGATGPSPSPGDEGSSSGEWGLAFEESAPVKFIDSERGGKCVVEGHIAIMLYLERAYGGARNEPPAEAPELARRLTRFQLALALLPKWRIALRTAAAKPLPPPVTAPSSCSANAKPAEAEAKSSTPPASTCLAAKPNTNVLRSAMRKDLAAWDGFAREAEAAAAGKQGAGLYIAAGERPSIADFALWPVLHDMVRVSGGHGVFDGHASLARYYRGFKDGSKAVAKVIGERTA